MAARLCLVLGGVRSGKSTFAEGLAAKVEGPKVYVATGVATDEEMEQRIRRHRDSRPDHWTTLEVPVDLPGSLQELVAQEIPGNPSGVVLIDSLDVWVANMMMELAGEDSTSVEEATDCHTSQILKLIRRSSRRFVVVSSEVGLSLVPPEPLGRRFQDLLGTVNQRVAAAADRVYLVVAGISLQIKGSDGV